MYSNPLILKARIEKLKGLDEEEEHSEEYALQKEEKRRSELVQYSTRRAEILENQQEEDYMLYANSEVLKQELDSVAKKNQHLREENLKEIRSLSEFEERKRNDELKDKLHVLNQQTKFKHNQWVEELATDKEARRDRINDRQVEADRNLIREKNRLAAWEKSALTLSECRQNEEFQKRRTIGKRAEYLEEKAKHQRNTRENDKNFIEYLDVWQKRGNNRSYTYNLTPLRY